MSTYNEHFVPTSGLDLSAYVAANDLSGAHHVVRYLWAAELIADRGVKKVLDVACGAGYGTNYLAGRFPNTSFLGADYDPLGVQNCQRAYERSNLKFCFGDVTRWNETIGVEEFDCIVSFDTIEHVAHRELMMESLVNHLTPDGILLLSTPSGCPENTLAPAWEGHRIEYNAHSLYDFLRRYFNTVIGQDMDGFAHGDVFSRLKPLEYCPTCNPVICSQPIRVLNPYHQRPAIVSEPPSTHLESMS
jgi:2-polyprenyl-3-methyl-5-hydroxy-6-metoxy-1,4-benzoquinol methylase